jgi:hypothetical protein
VQNSKRRPERRFAFLAAVPGVLDAELPDNRVNMKRLRIVILVLLAVLLPLRGALAATMMCPAGGTTTAVVAAVHDHHAMTVDAASHADHASMHHHAAAGAPDGKASTGEHPATCHFCASGCCMVTLLGSVPALADGGPSVTVEFPPVASRVPAYQSGGQDRPPRTI